MYIVFGVSNKKKVLATTPGLFQCHNCGKVSNWQLIKTKPFFTLFFILKLIPLGGYSYMYICPKCKVGYDVSSVNLNSIIASVGMSPKLNEELNSEKFKKALADTDAKLGLQNQNNI